MTPEMVARIQFPPPSVEAWICKQLEAPALLCGNTTAFERRDRIRARILELGLADATAGKRHGQPESWRALFFRLYGEDLFAASTTTNPEPEPCT